jgi:hypothetical protein
MKTRSSVASRRRMCLVRGLVLLSISGTQAGCMAMRLSSRGAPEQEMREFEIGFAAVDLPPAGDLSYNDQPTLAPVWTTVPVSGWLHGWDYRVVTESGDLLPRNVLHHLKVMSLSHRELFNPIMLHVAGAGGETKPVVLPKEAGYPLQEGDSLLVTAMLHNTTGLDLHGVQLRISFRYSPEGGSWRPPLPVVPFFAHVTPPMSDPSYDLPPGRSSRSIDLRPAVSGEILGLGGHLHRYGVLLRLEDLTEGEVIWEKEAELAADGQVLEVPYDRFVWSSLPRLRSDHTYRLTAVHDNPTGATLVGGGMGTLGGAIYVEEAWPDVDPHASEYVWYLNREATSAEHGGHDH